MLPAFSIDNDFPWFLIVLDSLCAWDQSRVYASYSLVLHEGAFNLSNCILNLFVLEKYDGLS